MMDAKEARNRLHDLAQKASRTINEIDGLLGELLVIAQHRHEAMAASYHYARLYLSNMDGDALPLDRKTALAVLDVIESHKRDQLQQLTELVGQLLNPQEDPDGTENQAPAEAP